MAKVYRGFAGWCLGHKAITLTVCVLALCGGACLLPLLGTAFFPKDLHGVFSVNVFLARKARPSARPRKRRSRLSGKSKPWRAARSMRIRHSSARAGRVSGFPSCPSSGPTTMPRSWCIRFIPAKRPRVVARLKRSLPPAVAAARVTIEQLETGPPVGVPVQIRLFGDDIETLRRMAAETKQALREIPGTDNIHDDWDSEVFQIPVTIKTEKANMAGITNEDVAMLLQAGLSGITPTYLREQDRLIPITFRLRSDERARIEEINELDAVSAATNLRVPISQIVDISMKLVSPKIWRRDHQRCITVKCDTASGVLASSVVAPDSAAARPAWPRSGRRAAVSSSAANTKSRPRASIRWDWPCWPRWRRSTWRWCLQFNSVTKPLVVFAGVPFGMVGGMMGLFPFGTPFGFMAFLGVASLGRRDRQPRDRACSITSKRPANAANRCGKR